MGFLKEVVPAPIRWVAFQYDGTQQSLDDLATELGSASAALNLTRISATTYQFTYVGTQQRDTDAVQIWGLYPSGELAVTPSGYENTFLDDTTYSVSWPDA